jgi:glycine cleavage system H protein
MKSGKCNDTPIGPSRREFLKDVGIIIGETALASFTLSSACNNSGASSTATVPTTSNLTQSINTTVASTQTALSSTSESYSLITVPGGTSKVALDRLYSIEHIWVKNLGSDIVQIGITDKFQLLLSNIGKIMLNPPGKTLKAGESFGSVEAIKMNTDLISPVSGNVIETNQSILELSHIINADPYGSWMLKVQLSDPSELSILV